MKAHPSNVLIVDDDEDICNNVSDILDLMGYRTSVAHDGPSALKLVQSQRFDVALLDYNMPGMDGVTLYRQIRQQQPETSAFLVTAHVGRATDCMTGTEQLEVIRKPVDFDAMLSRIEEVISRPRQSLNQGNS